ncbi:FAD linked oxidase domain protein [Mycobacterium avium subsp. avium 2285 (R)]|nr:FAD linked oxidase domain protein [Mycobacterium avium subsp. avium 2285 (R)]
MLPVGRTAQHVQVQVALADVAEQHRQRVGRVGVHQIDCGSFEFADRRQRQRHVELQRRPVHAEHLGQRLPDLPQPLPRNGIHADCRFAAERRVVQEAGEPLGLVVVGGQLHQQQPVGVDRGGHAAMLAGHRSRAAVDQFQRSDAVHVAERAPGGHHGIQVGEPADRRHRVRRGGVQSQVQLGDHAQRALGADEQRGQVVAGVVPAHPAAPAQQRAVGQRDLDAEHLLAHVAVPNRVQPTGIRGGHAADGRAVTGREVHAEHQVGGRRGLLHRGQRGPAPTSMRRSTVSTSAMRCSRSVDSNTSSCSGTVPATSDVRPPCTVTWAPASRHTRSTSASCSAEPGRTSALARPR